jgi:hypothetical protein
MVQGRRRGERTGQRGFSGVKKRFSNPTCISFHDFWSMRLKRKALGWRWHRLAGGTELGPGGKEACCARRGSGSGGGETDDFAARGTKETDHKTPQSSSKPEK